MVSLPVQTLTLTPITVLEPYVKWDIKIFGLGWRLVLFRALAQPAESLSELNNIAEESKKELSVGYE